ncbi:MAG: IS6 family transposase [Bdellovibrionales bacterium]|nr:IS6 family transposase [Bdellovibrionales bacterium]
MRFQQEVIWRCLLYYFKYPLSLRDVADLMADRGVSVHNSTIHRWVVKFGPELEKEFRKHKKPVCTTWFLDETYIKIHGEYKYLFRAVDKHGQTIDFVLRAKRDRKAAMAFLKKAIKGSGSPKAINVDQSKSNIGAIQQLNKYNRPKSNPIKMTKDKYRNNIVEQDHRCIKRKQKISMSFRSLKSAKAIIAGVEIVHMIFKGQSGCLPLINTTPESQFWGLVTI